MVSSATPTTASVPRLFPSTASRRAGTKLEVLLRLRDRVPGDGGGERDGDGNAHGEARVDEPERRRPAPAGQEQRADPEEGRRQEPAEEVIDAEGVHRSSPMPLPRPARADAAA